MTQELPPLIQKKLEEMEVRYRELEGLFARPDLPAPVRVSSQKEFGGLRKPMEGFQTYRRLLKEIADNEQLARDSGGDQELRALAREEVARLRPQLERLSGDLTEQILVDDRQADRNVIMEIRAGV